MGDRRDYQKNVNAGTWSPPHHEDCDLKAGDGRLTKYRVLGQMIPKVGTFWCWGTHRGVEKAVRTLKGAHDGELADHVIPERVGGIEKTPYFWIEKGFRQVEVTRDVLAQFVHGSTDEEMVTWAMEEIMRREIR